MDRGKVPIVLVFSMLPSLCGKLNEMLVRLGYTNTHKLGWDDLLNVKIGGINKVFVIPLSHKKILWQKMQPAFERIRKMPVLGVIQAHEKNFDVDFLKCFNEVLCWPCS